MRYEWLIDWPALWAALSVFADELVVSLSSAWGAFAAWWAGVSLPSLPVELEFVATALALGFLLGLVPVMFRLWALILRLAERA